MSAGGPGELAFASPHSPLRNSKSRLPSASHPPRETKDTLPRDIQRAPVLHGTASRALTEETEAEEGTAPVEGGSRQGWLSLQGSCVLQETRAFMTGLPGPRPPPAVL